MRGTGEPPKGSPRPLGRGGGQQYGGYFLAIRVIIAATNSDISFVPWQLDKFIPVEISIDDGIDVSNRAPPPTRN